MQTRWIAAALIALACVLASCENPRIVECEPGIFARVDGLPWCLYPTRSAECPAEVPEEHGLPWGGRGCTTEPVDPLPPTLCEAAGECGDAG